jgi:sarcosine oxidase subunit beta
VLEKGWLGGGNTGRNTTIVRSNYHLDPNAHFYEFSLKLWERLSQELNFNVMYSARGVLNLVHTPGDMDAAMRRGNAMRLNGIDAQFLSLDEIAARIPNLDCSPKARFPILGGLLQPRGGTVRHDAVAWGYARAADALGVDIIQRCEVTGIRVERGAVTGSGRHWVTSRHRRSASQSPVIRVASPRWRTSNCRSSRMFSRRWFPNQ